MSRHPFQMKNEMAKEKGGPCSSETPCSQQLAGEGQGSPELSLRGPNPLAHLSCWTDTGTRPVLEARRQVAVQSTEQGGEEHSLRTLRLEELEPSWRRTRLGGDQSECAAG